MCGFLSWPIKMIEKGYFFENLLRVISVVKAFNNVVTFLIGNLAVSLFFENDIYFCCAFVGILIFNVHFEESVDC